MSQQRNLKAEPVPEEWMDRDQLHEIFHGPNKPPTARFHQVGGSHYTEMAIQPWDAMRAWMSEDEFLGFLRGNCIKYLARAGTKQGSSDSEREDLMKAQHYLERLIEELS